MWNKVCWHERLGVQVCVPDHVNGGGGVPCVEVNVKTLLKEIKEDSNN